MRVATYNVHHCADGIDNVASVIRDMNVDIIGLQEIDCRNGRSNWQDQASLLADKTGMRYYEFTRAISFSGGEYGTAILSKHPITFYETIPLDSRSYESRVVGHATVDVDGVTVDFFNTHLSYENKDVRKAQFEQLKKLLKKSKRFVLTGDFNVDSLEEFDALNAKLQINRKERSFVTFPKGSLAIDNILMSDNFSETFATAVTESYSDHYALLAGATVDK